MTDQPIRRLDPPPEWLNRPIVRAVCAALGEARFVGGAVRDTLLGREVGDLDMATPLPPDQVTAKLRAARIKAIPTGIDHGTVTAILDAEKIEITTLRRDVETDGRHAVVEYTDNWAADAARRDFTMNALYLDGAGDLWDPLGGLKDCLDGRVRFVGDPGQRIAEDVLRLLRFYRFQAHYGRTEADPAARAACRAAVSQIGTLAGERIRNELLKLLMAQDPVPTLRLMAADGVLGALLPTPHGFDRLIALILLDQEPDPLRRLAALLPSNAVEVAERLKLSAKERDRLIAITAAEPLDLGADDPAQRRALYRLGASLYRDRVLLTAVKTGQPVTVARPLALAASWVKPSLPVTGADAIALGLSPGKPVGDLLRRVEAWWLENDFHPEREACLEQLCQELRGGG